jgi:hypothetical protein
MRRIGFLLWLSPILALTSCSDAFDSNLESVSVLTESAAGPVTGAGCVLSNDSGTWYVMSPGSVTVHRASEQLIVTCGKPGYRTATIDESSVTDYGAIFVQGAIASTISGSAWNYPQLITVPMTPLAVSAAN